MSDFGYNIKKKQNGVTRSGVERSTTQASDISRFVFFLNPTNKKEKKSKAGAPSSGNKVTHIFLLFTPSILCSIVG